MEKKQKIISAVVFIMIIFLFPIVFIFSPEKDFSEEENRKLAENPQLKISAIFDKSYMSDMDEFLSDNFPGRINWVKSKMIIDRLTGKNIINNIYLGDMLIERLPEPDYEEVNKSVQAINQFADHYDTETSFLLAPTSAGIYMDRLPLNAPQLDQREFIITTLQMLNDNVNGINIFDAMTAEKENYIYYRTDHHWTSLGAYTAYKQAASALGFEPISIEKFEVEHASGNFKGTFYNKCFYGDVAPDIIDIYSCEDGNEVEKVVMNDGIKETEADSIYFKNYLNVNDKYCVFLGGNRAFTNIKTNDENGKKLLVIKDSYANALIPFLVNHYSEISVIDLRYVKTSMTEFVDPNEYDQTLFLYNASTFSKDTNVKMAGFF